MRDFLISLISFAILAFTYWVVVSIFLLVVESISSFLGLPDHITWFCAGAAFVMCQPFKTIKRYSFAVFTRVQDFVWRRF